MKGVGVPPFNRIIRLVSIIIAGLAAAALPIGAASAAGPAPQADSLAALKFFYQAQGGLTTYAQITTSFNLAQMSQTLTSIDAQSPDFVLGDYTLSGRTDKVKLAIGAGGWALAYFPNTVGVEYLFDDYDNYFTSLPAKAVGEIAGMVGVTTTSPGYYDARYPAATGIVIHALYQSGNKDITSSVTLPISNIYLDRGYAFFTAASNSKFWLNADLIDHQDAIYNIIYRWGKLDATQLRAGQTNVLHTYSLTIFGSGFIAGVGVEYTGAITPTAAGGAGSNQYALAYPTMLGAPLDIQQLHIPVMIGP